MITSNTPVGIMQPISLEQNSLHGTLSHVDNTIDKISRQASKNIKDLEEIVANCQKEGRPVPAQVSMLLDSQKNITKPLKRVKRLLEIRLYGGSEEPGRYAHIDERLQKIKQRKVEKMHQNAAQAIQHAQLLRSFN